MDQHWIEFNYITPEETARVLKWCRTCCFQPWHTQTNEHQQFRLCFQSEMDARRFVWRFEDYFNPLKR